MNNFIHQGMQLPFNPCRCGGSPSISCGTNPDTRITVIIIRCSSCTNRMTKAFSERDESNQTHPIIETWQEWNKENPVNKDGIPFEEMLMLLTVNAASAYQAYINTMRLISKMCAGHEGVSEDSHQAVHDFVDSDTQGPDRLAARLCANARKP